MGLESLRAKLKAERIPDPVRIARGHATWAKTKAIYDYLDVLNVKLKMYGVPGVVNYFGRDSRWANDNQPLRIFRPNRLAISCDFDEIEDKIDEYIALHLKWEVDAFITSYLSGM